MKISSKAVISALGIALAIVAQLKLLDDVGLRHTEDGLNRALVTYGISRSLNGVISVVQGTEVAIEPVGVGMTFTPGQILDPINDLIERFSTVVLVSGTAFGIQRVFLDLVSATAFSVFTGLAIIVALSLMWFGSRVPAGVKPPIYRAVIIFLIIRFSVPVTAIASENFYLYFLAPQYQSSSEQLISTTDQLQDIQSKSENTVTDTSVNSGQEKSLLDSARELYRSATSTFDMRQHLDDFKLAAENISEHAIKLIVVFLFQTIILPLASIWLMLQAIKWVASGKAGLGQD
ncbi:MAG: hypothetical protein HKN85_11500 [Gammaproteobacteria bacterium]|nr:hypothetical protein [Gammaproteobacteria bacterium]